MATPGDVLLFPVAEVSGEFPSFEEALGEGFLGSGSFGGGLGGGLRSSTGGGFGGASKYSVVVVMIFLKHAEGQDHIFYGAAARKIGDNSGRKAIASQIIYYLSGFDLV